MTHTVKRALALPVAIMLAAGTLVSIAVIAPARAAAEATPGGLTLTASATAPAPYVPTRAEGQPVPVAPADLPVALESFAEYQGQAQCTPGAQPGSLRLAALLRDTYGPADIGIERDCGVGGQSEHKEGRALDWMLSYQVPAEKATVEAFLWWLLQPDADGNPAAMAKRLGVMYLGWHDRIWKSYAADNGWTELKGCYSKQTAADDTYCHRDHLHISLSWDAAAARTSFWDLSAETLAACPEPNGVASDPNSPLATAVTALTPMLLVSTRTGAGLATGPCRLESDRWSGDGRALEVPVLGRGGVPATDVAAVRIRVGVAGSNAPTAVVAAATRSTVRRSWTLDGADVGNTIEATQNRWAAGEIIAPVSTAGTVVLTNLSGAVDLRVIVTGWVGVGVVVPPPPAPTVVPTFTRGLLTVGARGPAVAALQRALVNRGYRISSLQPAGAFFGRYRADTAAAVSRYQAKHPRVGPVTGRVTPRLYLLITKVLGTPATPSVSLSALLAHAPAPVRVVQAALNSVVAAGLTVDGLWGTRSQAAWDRFRVEVMGLTGTHEPGPTSLAELGRRAGFSTSA